MKRRLSLTVALILLLMPAAPATAQGGSAELTFWESVRDSKDAAEIEAYLQTYPDGKFAPLARIRLKKLRSGAAGGAREQPPNQAIATKARKESITVKIGTLPDSKRGWLGVQIGTVTEEWARAFGLDKPRGALVFKVTPNSPADVAGIRPADVIVEFDGRDIAQMPELPQMVAATPPGSEVKVAVWRAARDSDELLAWFRGRADKGDTDAMYGLGRMYDRGIGVAKDVAEAVRWLRKAAEKGHLTAMNNLGVAYDRGRGVAKDEAEAVRWYRKAAKKGDAIAMTNLGVMFAGGRGVRQDHVKATKWFRKAAEKGHSEAMKALAYRYWSGLGVAKNYTEAVKWYRKAAEKGDGEAVRWLSLNGGDQSPEKAGPTGPSISNQSATSEVLEKLPDIKGLEELR